MTASALHWTTSESGDALRVAMHGDITERSTFGELTTALAGHRVRLDLSGIKRVNSSGVRQWLLFMKDVSSHQILLSIERCSPVIVHQLNMVAGFAGPASVLSVMAPFACSGCDATREEQVPLDGDLEKLLTSQRTCGVCGADLELDDLLSYYVALGRRAATDAGVRSAT
jgi:anti-anti-sigma regulatory factor